MSILRKDWNMLEKHSEIAHLTPVFVNHKIDTGETFITCKIEDLQEVCDNLIKQVKVEIPNDWNDF